MMGTISFDRDGMRSDLVDIEVEIIHETDRAVLIDMDGKRVWLPLSQIEVDRENGVVTMREWLAKEKELI